MLAHDRLSQLDLDIRATERQLSLLARMEREYGSLHCDWQEEAALEFKLHDLTTERDELVEQSQSLDPMARGAERFTFEQRTINATIAARFAA